MAKIKVMAECPLYDGMPVTFQAPCDCTAVEGLRVCHENTIKDFSFRDTHGNDLAGIGNLFTEGAYVKALLDTVNGYAYLQNADTNAYLESRLASAGVNPNLLDNWYFGNPVNQRGKTAYTEKGYTIDRWEANQPISVVVNASSVSLSNNSGATCFWFHWLDNIEDLLGKQVTTSALTADGRLLSATGKFPDATTSGNSYSTTAYINNDVYISALSTANMLAFAVRVGNGGSADLIAVKLELGSQQTLARQDENGNWVLNEIPNYHEELLKCCMSTADSADAYANNKKTPSVVNAFGFVESVPAGTNLDDVLKPGSYYITNANSESILNRPISGKYASNLHVFNANGDGINRAIQIFAKNSANAASGNTLYYRTINRDSSSAIIGAWKSIATDITYGTTDLTAGVSELAAGNIYLVYE